MTNKAPKYKIGDILQLNEDNRFKKKVILVSPLFYDETGLSEDIYYYVQSVNDDSYPPSPIKESAIDKYYTKILDNFETQQA